MFWRKPKTKKQYTIKVAPRWRGSSFYGFWIYDGSQLIACDTQSLFSFKMGAKRAAKRGLKNYLKYGSVANDGETIYKVTM